MVDIPILRYIFWKECTGLDSNAPMPDSVPIISPPKNLNQLILVKGRQAYIIELDKNEPTTIEPTYTIKEVDIAPMYDLNNTDIVRAIIRQNNISPAQLTKNNNIR